MEDGLERASERASDDAVDASSPRPHPPRYSPRAKSVSVGGRPASRATASVESARSMKNNQGHLSLPTSCRPPRCRYATRNRLPTATWYFSLKGPPLLRLPSEAFAPCAAGWHRRAGNGLPFARCQILPKVDGRDGGRREERNGEATTAMEEEEEEAKMMERQTSGRKEGGRDFSHGLAP